MWKGCKQIVFHPLYVLFLLTATQADKCYQNINLAKSHGQYNLVGLVPSKTRFGLIVAEAIKFAVDQINEEIFNSTTILGYELYYTCSNHDLELLTKVTTELLLRDSETTGICSCQNAERTTVKYIGFVGPAYSFHALLMNQIMSSFKFPIISFYATSTELKPYTNFFRTIPADNIYVKALLDLVEHFKWSYISVIGSSDSYGFHGKIALTDLLRLKKICVHVNELITIPYEIADIYNIVQKLRNAQIENPSASVVILFALDFVVYDIWKVSEHLQLFGVTWIIVGDVSTSLSLSKFHPDVINGLFTFYYVGGLYPGFEEHLMNIFHQHSENDLLSMFLYENNITTSETYKKVLSSSIFVSGFVRNAVFAYGYALKSYLASVCSNQSFGNCYTNHKFNKTSFLNKYLRNISLPGLYNDTVCFDETGDVKVAMYQLQNVQYKQQELSIQPVGTWDSNDGLQITQNIVWATGKSSIPLSQCSETCQPRYYPVVNIGKRCCWICLKCEVGFIKPTYGNDPCIYCPEKLTNVNQTKCVEFKWLIFPQEYRYAVFASSSGGILSCAFVILSLFKFRNTPIIKASIFNLSMIQVCSQLLLFITLAFFVMDNSKTICISFFFVVGSLWTFIISILLVKSEQILRVFKFQTKTTAQDVIKTKAISIGILLCTCIIESLLIGYLLVFSNGHDKVVYYFHNLEKEKICNVDVPARVQSLYISVLALVCGVSAFRGRKLPSKYSEAHAIVYAVFFILVLVALFIPLQLSASNGKMKRFILYVVIYCSNVVILFFMYAYKIWIVWCKPECNRAVVFQRSRYVNVLNTVEKRLNSMRKSHNSLGVIFEEHNC